MPAVVSADLRFVLSVVGLSSCCVFAARAFSLRPRFGFIELIPTYNCLIHVASSESLQIQITTSPDGESYLFNSAHAPLTAHVAAK